MLELELEFSIHRPDKSIICRKFSSIIALRCCSDDHNDKQNIVVGLGRCERVLTDPDDVRYLWQCAVELSLQRVSLMADLV